MRSVAEIVALALETLSRELKAATSSMTSVPKPLKFLRPHMDRLVDRYNQLPEKTTLKVILMCRAESAEPRRLLAVPKM